MVVTPSSSSEVAAILNSMFISLMHFFTALLYLNSKCEVFNKLECVDMAAHNGYWQQIQPCHGILAEYQAHCGPP